MLKLGGFLSRTMEIYYHWLKGQTGNSKDIFKVFQGSLLYEGHVFDNKDLSIIWPFFSSSAFLSLNFVLLYKCTAWMSCDIQYSNLSLNEHRNQHKDIYYSILCRKDFLSSLHYLEWWGYVMNYMIFSSFCLFFLKLFSLLFFFQLEKEILTGGRLPVIMSVINLNMQYIHTTYYTNISAWLILYF